MAPRFADGTPRRSSRLTVTVMFIGVTPFEENAAAVRGADAAADGVKGASMR
jgi:hypothetical protein